MAEEMYPLKELTEKIIGAAFKVHNRLGSGFQEKVYENALVPELSSIGLNTVQQKPLKVLYGGQPVGDFIADVLVEGQVLVELKANRALEKSLEDQLLNYSKSSGIRSRIIY
ncbi:MAG: GxxExxY protein [Ignavibacteriales bacterium]|nr:GxxExxY protein [Ignavibacteriales bacterium]